MNALDYKTIAVCQ